MRIQHIIKKCPILPLILFAHYIGSNIANAGTNISQGEASKETFSLREDYDFVKAKNLDFNQAKEWYSRGTDIALESLPFGERGGLSYFNPNQPTYSTSAILFIEPPEGESAPHIYEALIRNIQLSDQDLAHGEGSYAVRSALRFCFEMTGRSPLTMASKPEDNRCKFFGGKSWATAYYEVRFRQFEDLLIGLVVQAKTMFRSEKNPPREYKAGEVLAVEIFKL